MEGYKVSIVGNICFISPQCRIFFSVKEDITFGLIKGCAALVFAGSKLPFTLAELDALQLYLDDGGSIFVLLGEGNSLAQCNINILLEKYGIVPNSGKYKNYFAEKYLKKNFFSLYIEN